MRYSTSQYTKAILGVLPGKNDQEVGKLMQRLQDHMRTFGDEKFLPAVVRDILKKLYEAKKAQAARIVSSTSLNEKEKRAIKNAFPASAYEFEKNETILGGMVIQHGANLYRYTLADAIKNFVKKS